MNKNVWEIIWDYDPNGLLVINENLEIQIVNPAFAKYFNLEKVDILGRKVTDFFTDIEDFIRILVGETDCIRGVKDREETGLTFSEVTFKIEDQGLIAKIFHNVTPQDKEIQELKLKITDDVQKIVEKQMKVVQEVASLLGETTAETKATVSKLLNILKKEG